MEKQITEIQKNLKLIRVILDIKQEDFAALFGVTRPAYSGYETMKTPINRGTVFALYAMLTVFIKNMDQTSMQYKQLKLIMDMDEFKELALKI